MSRVDAVDLLMVAGSQGSHASRSCARFASPQRDHSSPYRGSWKTATGVRSDGGNSRNVALARIYNGGAGVDGTGGGRDVTVSSPERVDRDCRPPSTSNNSR